MEQHVRERSTNEMLRLPRAYEWVSGHLFYHGDLDLPVSLLVRPLVDDLIGNGLVQQFFFVRHWEGGDHLRIRLLPSSSRHRLDTMALLKERADRFVESFPSTDNPAADAYPELAERWAAAEGRTEYERRLSPNNSLRFQPYVRETERYGEGRVMAAVERHFVESSELALRFVREGRSTAHRDTFGLMALLTAWFCCEPDTFALRRYLTFDGAGGLTGDGGRSPGGGFDDLGAVNADSDADYRQWSDRLTVLAQRAWALATSPSGPGAPRAPGSTATSSSATTPGSTAAARSRTAPGAQRGGTGSAADSSDDRPLAHWIEAISRLRQTLAELADIGRPTTPSGHSAFVGGPRRRPDTGSPAGSPIGTSPGSPVGPSVGASGGFRGPAEPVVGPLGNARIAQVIDRCAHLFCNRIGIPAPAERQLRRLAAHAVADLPRPPQMPKARTPEESVPRAAEPTRRTGS